MVRTAMTRGPYRESKAPATGPFSCPPPHPDALAASYCEGKIVTVSRPEQVPPWYR